MTSSLRAHAERELDLVGETGAMRQHLLCMVDAFADEGHSGFSAAHAVAVLAKLLAYEPLMPLTGADSEWVSVDHDLWQNTRCSHVFKSSQHAYDISGKVFRDPDGSCWGNGDSRVTVTFPYSPHTEIVDRQPEVPTDD